MRSRFHDSNSLTNRRRDAHFYVGELEDYGLVPVNQNPILNMRAHGAREDDFFQVASFADQIFDRVAMRDADDVLLEDRSVVEQLGDVVAGRSDLLHAAFEGLMVRSGAHERRQKGMMDVDNALLIPVHEFVGQDLHIAREHYEVRPTFVK